MQNLIILQFFHWYYNDGGCLWNDVAGQGGQIKNWGFTHVWLPPAYKSAKGSSEPGYAVYDLYDLGEFDQKGSVRTKYGTKYEYLLAIKALHDKGLKVLADVVLNHRTGGDEKETVALQRVNEEKRNEKEGDPFEAEIFTRFTFPGRKGKYSSFTWDSGCFTGVRHEDSPCMIVNQYTEAGWQDMIDAEKQNYDYLLGIDVNYRNPAVSNDVQEWIKWYLETTRIDGIRLDGLKHMSPNFILEWLRHCNGQRGEDFLVIGEFWKNDKDILLKYLQATEREIQLFDVPLHFNFQEASEKGGDYDLRQLQANTLMEAMPESAITFVDNHDTQPFQALQSWVKEWFKPLAYAFILLREQGIPCVFHPVMYGAEYTHQEKDSDSKYMKIEKLDILPILLAVRDKAAYGWQHSHFEQPNIIGWGREGIDEKEDSGCAVLMSNKSEGQLSICMGTRNAGKTFRNCFYEAGAVKIDENGCGLFSVNARSVSVWINTSLNI